MNDGLLEQFYKRILTDRHFGLCAKLGDTTRITKISKKNILLWSSARFRNWRARRPWAPIRDFDFDAAIMFSDLLFPLEAMGMGLEYVPGPKLGWHLNSKENLPRLQSGDPSFFQFQADAIDLIRFKLPREKGLIGFVGAPLTLFVYAAVGSHKGSLENAIAGLTDGRFEGFFEKLLPLLSKNMEMQAQAGLDAIALFDTCAGDIPFDLYQKVATPFLQHLLERFKKACPDTPVIYYSKNTQDQHWECLTDLPINCIGVDWNNSLEQVLDRWTDRFAIQGNINSNWMLLEEQKLIEQSQNVFDQVKKLPAKKLDSWVFGLGHGVLKQTPESNVKALIKLFKDNFAQRDG